MPSSCWEKKGVVGSSVCTRPIRQRTHVRTRVRSRRRRTSGTSTTSSCALPHCHSLSQFLSTRRPLSRQQIPCPPTPHGRSAPPHGSVARNRTDRRESEPLSTRVVPPQAPGDKVQATTIRKVTREAGGASPSPPTATHPRIHPPIHHPPTDYCPPTYRPRPAPPRPVPQGLGGADSERVKVKLCVLAEAVDFDGAAGELRVRGRNLTENEHVKLGGESSLFHSVALFSRARPPVSGRSPAPACLSRPELRARL